MAAIECAALRAFAARLDRARLYDWMMRIPVIGYSLYVLRHDVLGFYAQVASQQAAFQRVDAAVMIAVLARVSQWIFVALLAVLPVFRLPPIGKSEQLWPRLVALAAAGLIPLFMLLERAPARLGFNAASLLLGLCANIMCIVTVSFLGRSLSVMPEARRLVTGGPYAMVRHPLYLCEIAGVAAMVLQYRSLGAIGLLALIVVVQTVRGGAEETVLARAFPEFSGYRARTPFLVPRDPARFLTVFAVDAVVRRRAALAAGGAVAASALVLMLLPLLAR
jgi:protein-S-isoprenylcysteine O-methyltransferase Ste14